MGEFEDLLQRIREGDTAAADELEQKYSGSTLRTKAEEADRYKAIADKAMPVLRQNRVEELKEKLPEEIRDFASVDDFADADPESITLEDLQDKAQTRSQAEATRKLAAAQDAGFETVEEYEAALDTVKQTRQNRQEGMEAVGGAAASGGGDPTGGDGKEPFDRAKDSFEKAKSEGRADDHAMANAVDSLMNDQMVELDTSE